MTHDYRVSKRDKAPPPPERDPPPPSPPPIPPTGRAAENEGVWREVEIGGGMCLCACVCDRGKFLGEARDAFGGGIGEGENISRELFARLPAAPAWSIR
jgi:hypothetical protein